MNLEIAATGKFVSKGRPTGILKKLPSWMQRWFTWTKTYQVDENLVVVPLPEFERKLWSQFGLDVILKTFDAEGGDYVVRFEVKSGEFLLFSKEQVVSTSEIARWRIRAEYQGQSVDLIISVELVNAQ